MVYFAKVPAPGRVKTRLCPPLTPAEAAGLYSGFLRDVLRPVPEARTIVYAWPAEEISNLHEITDLEIRPQRGADLWERMTVCFDELLEAGHSAVVLRNTDSPDLPPDIVEQAIERARPGRVVLGPDAGGGYYLVALAEPCPALFQADVEGAATVFESTVARARELGLEVDVLAEHRDVDDYDDLLALWRGRARD